MAGIDLIQRSPVFVNTTQKRTVPRCSGNLAVQLSEDGCKIVILLSPKVAFKGKYVFRMMENVNANSRRILLSEIVVTTLCIVLIRCPYVQQDTVVLLKGKRQRVRTFPVLCSTFYNAYNHSYLRKKLFLIYPFSP